MRSLERFVDAQQGVFATALSELKAGAKQSHWMWFIFPQIDGLGRSATARYFAISGMEEAKAYLAHPVLGGRLVQCTNAVLSWSGKHTAEEIFGPIDALKFGSSMTLFEAAGAGTRFSDALDAFYGGHRDEQTLALLGQRD